MKAEEIIFDLLAQDFEVKKKCADSRYIVSKNVTIDMNMFIDNGNYITCNKTIGYFNITLNKTITNFTFDTNFIIENSARSSRNGEILNIDQNPVSRSIKFTDEVGNTLNIIFEKDEMKINEKTYKVKLDFQDLVPLTVNNSNGDLSVTIDGQKIYTNKNVLSKIKFVDILLYNSPIAFDSASVYDRLRTLRLISND